MGTTTYYSDDLNFSSKFEILVIKILRSNGFKIESGTIKSYDFNAVLDNIFALVEVKLYRSKIPKLDLINLAILQLQSQKENPNAKLILIVSSVISPVLQREIFEKNGVVIWDAKILFALAFETSELYYELENLLVKAYREELGDISIVENGNVANILENLRNSKSNKATKPAPQRGKDLCEELHLIKSGKADASKFEKKCIEILKYLFDNERDLTLWNAQPTSDNGLHRFDLLCRIIAYKNTVWSELSDDFHSRYVIFEFKNYKKAITQSEIYTTEKYLFLTALRSISIIIAKNGADKNAKITAKGALKEAGKLILIITPKDLCEMLDAKDLGNEPSFILREKIDEMLTKLTR